MHILLAVSGGIAAYKCPELVRLIVKKGWTVQPIMTDAAHDFVSETALTTLSGRETRSKNGWSDGGIDHLSLTREADILVVCPATANSMGKFANGLSDDLVSTCWMSFTGPKLLVPAMHAEMWESPANEANIQRLKSLPKTEILGPVQGELACGDRGMGRMVELSAIIEKLELMQTPKLDLSGQSVLVTVGGTQEPVDPVRVLTNRSTGKMGMTIARVAALSGARVGVISTLDPTGYSLFSEEICVKTVAELSDELSKRKGGYDHLFMAAAVSDYTATFQPEKLKRSDELTLALQATPDLVEAFAKENGARSTVAFCLESKDLEKTALKKLREKGADYIVANRIDSIGQPKRTVSLYRQSGQNPIQINNQPLQTVAQTLLSEVCQPA